MKPSPLHFQTRGSSKHAALVFLHGFLGSGSDWEPVARELADSHFIVMPDLPGHGQSAAADCDFTFAGTAAHLIAVLDQNRITSAGLIGYSMGARIALWTALAHPHRFTHLVLEGCNPGIQRHQERVQRQRWEDGITAQLQNSAMTDFVAAWYDMPLFASLQGDPDRLARIRRVRAAGQDKQGLVRVMRGLGLSRQDDLWPRLEEIAIPVLLITGEYDARFGEISAEMVRRLRWGRCEVVPGAGHNVHLERRADFCYRLRAFLP